MSTPKAPTSAPGRDGWTIDELAGRVGLTVRTTRYYASLGLIPPPSGRRGRIAIYDDRHRVRLELIRVMQERGFALSGIEQQLRRIPPDTPAGELELRLAMLSSWAPPPREIVTRDELAARAERDLTDEDVSMLERLGTIRREGEDRYEVMPTFAVGVGLLDLDIPPSAAQAAGEAISDAMDDLVERLRDIMRTEVLEPIRARRHPVTDAAELERMMTGLRQLTLDAVVGNFQQAANRLTELPEAPGSRRSGSDDRSA
jgi:DNA-binding transcriptional MerR regulator